MPNQCRIGAQCQIEANGVDTETHTVPIILTDETQVVRWSWDKGYYYLRLLHGDSNIDFARQDILYLFDNHQTYTMPFARLENVRLDDKQVKADAVFDPDDEESMKIFNKLAKGFLRTFSAGVDIYDMVLTEEKDGDKYYDAVAWGITEASLAYIPANPNAVVGLTHDTHTETLATMPSAPREKIANSTQGNPMEFNKENFEKLLAKSSDLETELAKAQTKAEEMAKKAEDAPAAEAERLQKIIASVGLNALQVESVAAVAFSAGASITDVEAAMFRHEKSQREKQAGGQRADGEALANLTHDIDGTDAPDGDTPAQARHKSIMAKLKKEK